MSPASVPDDPKEMLAALWQEEKLTWLSFLHRIWLKLSETDDRRMTKGALVTNVEEMEDEKENSDKRSSTSEEDNIELDVTSSLEKATRVESRVGGVISSGDSSQQGQTRCDMLR